MQNVNFIPELSPDLIFTKRTYVQSDLIKKPDRPDGIYRDGFPRHHAPLVILENKIKRILLRTKNKQRYLPEWFGPSFFKVAFTYILKWSRSLSILKTSLLSKYFLLILKIWRFLGIVHKKIKTNISLERLWPCCEQ